MLNLEADIQLSARKIHSILDDAKKTAEAINLVYVEDKQSGINRVKKGDSFHYLHGKKKVTDPDTLDRIKKLVIPPAWENVWICPLDNGHLQATGIDVKKRKQYKYHAHWNALRNQTKFYRLHAFGKTIPVIRERLEKDLSLPGMPVEKVLAAVVCLMEQTSIRIGNSIYEQLYGSFGLTTLKDKHVSIKGNQIQFIFKGKKAVEHNISINNKRLAKIVQQCRDIPGKELFQYYDENGNRKCVDSGLVNSYVKEISGHDFTAKDFRTWAGTVHALIAFKEIILEELAMDQKTVVTKKQSDNTKAENEIKLSKTSADIKKNIVCVLDRVAAHLGNTRTVCKKYYVHPVLITLYENNNLSAYLKLLDKAQHKIKPCELIAEEKLLMTILEKERLVCL